MSIDSDLTGVSLEGQIKPVARHSGRLLLEYRDTRSKFATRPVTSGSGGADIYSVGGTWHWQTTDWLALTAAGRLDHFEIFLNSEPRGFDASPYDRILTEPTYNVGLVADVTDRDTIRLSSGSGVLLPSHVDIFFSIPAPPNALGITAISGDPRIDSAKNVSIELGWRHDFADIDAALDAGVFWQRQSDLRSIAGRASSPTLAVVGGEVLSLPRNVGKTTIIGAELAFDGRVAKDWTYRLGYTLLDVDDDLDVNQAVRAFAIGSEESTPTHSVDLGIGYAYDPFETDLGFHWQFKRTLLTPNDTPTFEIGEVDTDHAFNLTGRAGCRLNDRADLSLIGTSLLGGDWGPGLDIDSQVLLSFRWVLEQRAPQDSRFEAPGIATASQGMP